MERSDQSRKSAGQLSANQSTQEIRLLLKALMNQADNLLCLDCKDRRPTWATLIVPPPGAPFETLGGFCCFQCSAAHRQLGTHICFVRSTNLDEWKPKEFEAMQRGGNKLLNAIFEANLKKMERDDVKPNSRTEMMERTIFVTDKYSNRKWYNIARFDVLVKSASNLTPSSDKPTIFSTPRGSRLRTNTSTPLSTNHIRSFVKMPKLDNNMDLEPSTYNRGPSLFETEDIKGKQRGLAGINIPHSKMIFNDSVTSLIMDDMARNVDTDWWKNSIGSDQFMVAHAKNECLGNHGSGGNVSGRIFSSGTDIDIISEEKFFQNIHESTKKKGSPLSTSPGNKLNLPHKDANKRDRRSSRLAYKLLSLDEDTEASSPINRLKPAGRQHLMQTLQRMESKSRLLDEIRDSRSGIKRSSDQHESTAKLKVRRASQQKTNQNFPFLSPDTSSTDRRELMQRMESKSKVMDEISNHGIDSNNWFKNRRSRRISPQPRRGSMNASDSIAHVRDGRIAPRRPSFHNEKSLALCDLASASDEGSDPYRSSQQRHKRSSSARRRVHPREGLFEYDSYGKHRFNGDQSDNAIVITSTPRAPRSGRRISVSGKPAGSSDSDLKDSIHCLDCHGNERTLKGDTDKREPSQNNSFELSAGSRSRSQSASRRHARTSKNISDGKPQMTVETGKKNAVGSDRDRRGRLPNRPQRSSSCKDRRPRRRFERAPIVGQRTQDNKEDFQPLGDISSMKRSLKSGSNNSSTFVDTTKSDRQRCGSGRRPPATRHTRSAAPASSQAESEIYQIIAA